MTEQITNDKVIAWLSNYLSIPSSKISVTSRICEDLGVDGDDALELLAAYAETFGVDCKQFDFKKYFGPEAGPHILSPLVWIYRSVMQPSRNFLKVEDLIEGAKKGSLIKN